MKMVITDVGGMVSPPSARGLKKQLAHLPGVHDVEVNHVASSATAMYAETRTDLKTIKAQVRKCGYHCAGELTAKHSRQADRSSALHPEVRDWNWGAREMPKTGSAGK